MKLTKKQVKNVTYSNEGTSSTMLMYRQSSSIKSSFVGLTYGDRTDDCDRASSCDDSIKSEFVGLTDDEMTNDSDKNSTFDDECDVLSFFGGLIYPESHNR